ncbi:GNAT family N-acetyltransferase [Oceanobacillus kapialis]|uniref:GNAT family N-acetyltransferase n=1 Tax=Oceanobacillus kapialis TaxID=481353 RepID=A0ABW5Q418_9BACI
MTIGDRVYLRPIHGKDIDGIFDSLQEEEGLYMTGTRKVFTKEEVQNAYERFNKDSTRHDFAICLVENDQMIGDLAINDIDWDNRKAMFRIALHNKDNYGKGYGTEAVKLAQKFTFEELKLNRLELQVYSHNPRGIRSYEKAGFKREGVLRQSLFMNGRYSDEIIMSILYEEYAEGKS